MKKPAIIILIFTMLLVSCTKQVTCEGILYSPQGYLMPDETVYFHIYGSASSYPTGGTSCTTDKSGRFNFYLKVNKKHPMELECRTDSGYIRKSLGKPRDGTDFYEIIKLHW